MHFMWQLFKLFMIHKGLKIETARYTKVDTGRHKLIHCANSYTSDWKKTFS